MSALTLKFAREIYIRAIRGDYEVGGLYCAQASDAIDALICMFEEAFAGLDDANKEIERIEKEYEQALEDAVKQAQEEAQNEIDGLKEESAEREAELETELHEAQHELARFASGARAVLLALCADPLLQREMNDTSTGHEPVMVLLFVQAVATWREMISRHADEQIEIAKHRARFVTSHIKCLLRATKPELAALAVALGLDGEGTKQTLAEAIAEVPHEKAKAAILDETQRQLLNKRW